MQLLPDLRVIIQSSYWRLLTETAEEYLFHDEGDESDH